MLIYLIIEQYFLVKDDSKISKCCGHGELFICQAWSRPVRAIPKFKAN